MEIERQDGRPRYIAGPVRVTEKARAIARQLETQGGYFTLPLGDVELGDVEIVDEWDDEFDEDEFEEDDLDEDNDFEHDFEGAAFETDDPDAVEEPRQKPPRRWWRPWR